MYRRVFHADQVLRSHADKSGPGEKANAFWGRLRRHGRCLRAHSNLPARLRPFLEPARRDCTAEGQHRGSKLRRRGGLPVRVFGPVKRRLTVSGICEQAEDYFVEWCPDLPAYESCNRRLNRWVSFLPRSPLSDISCTKTQKEGGGAAKSTPITLAKGLRAS